MSQNEAVVDEVHLADEGGEHQAAEAGSNEEVLEEEEVAREVDSVTEAEEGSQEVHQVGGVDSVEGVDQGVVTEAHSAYCLHFVLRLLCVFSPFSS